MINLLPLKYKEALRREENLRVVFVLEILLAAFLISFALILFAIKIHIAGKVEAQKIFVELKNKEFSGAKPVEEKLNLINKKISGLESFYQNQFDLTDFLGRISELLPEGVYLNSFSYQKEGRQINLSGFAPTVNALLEFKNNLEKQKDFNGVYFPATIWMQSLSIDFNAGFKITPEEYGGK